jgi:biopolymer transport protein ExbD
MAEVKGIAARLIEAPGYHIGPKYDLKYLRRRKFSDGKREFSTVLPLTSMIDMFSMLVIFLLLNFSATGEVFYVNHDLKVPIADHGHVLESLPIISITADSVIFDVEKVGNNPLRLEEKDQNLPKLKAYLQKLRIMEQTMAPNRPFKGAVNIQADETTRIVYVKRVMNTLISEGWTNISFAVRPAKE